MAAHWDDGPNAHAGLPQVSFPRMTPVVKRLLVWNGVAFAAFFLLWYTSSGGASPVYLDTLSWLGLDRERWANSFPLVPVWQLLTYGFLHSVTSAWHVLGNMLMLYFFGTMLEGRLGGRRFFLTYLAAQVAGALLFLLPACFGLGGLPAIGASGAVFGVMIAVAVLYPRQIVYLFFLPIPLKWLAIGVVGLEVFAALVDFKVGPDGTAHLVHLGGAAYGYFAVKFGLVQKDPIEMLERRRAVQEVERVADDEARMDRLLEKIHREGMGSLSRAEKDFLKRMSSRR